MRRGSAPALLASWGAAISGLVLATIVSSFARTAGATEAPRPIRIDYAAPSSCPGRATLVAHVRARTASARLAEVNEPARDVVVRVEKQDGGRFHGRLVLPAVADGAVKERELDDAKCEDLIDALGFFIALSIEAETSSPAAHPTPEKPAAKESDAGTTPRTPPLVASVTPPVAPPPGAPPQPASEPESPVRASTSTTRGRLREPAWRVGGGVGAAVVGGLASNMLLGTRAALELARDPGDGLSVAPSVSVSAVSTLTDTAGDMRGAIALRWLAFVGTICPIALPVSSFVYLRPCSGLEVGSLRGEGVGIDGARRSYATWVAVGVSGRFEILLSSSLLLELDVGGAAPFERPRFGYTSGTVAFEAPPFGARTGLSLAFRQ